ncbi:hypothetical protein Y032_0374g208 [Ancylostoma ceylanicum]|uniref:Uncharacterized protein n=1 Tax=Ancylostoma ceylanicum TaxID=53326 RepID=A0A016RTY3_9BILA|nr:hypothetical protein Y032_0374g208 [Ancylostoma ceylanicum]
MSDGAVVRAGCYHVYCYGSTLVAKKRLQILPVLATHAAVTTKFSQNMLTTCYELVVLEGMDFVTLCVSRFLPLFPSRTALRLSSCREVHDFMII